MASREISQQTILCLQSTGVPELSDRSTLDLASREHESNILIQTLIWR
jgi:hypothetical protein